MSWSLRLHMSTLCTERFSPNAALNARSSGAHDPPLGGVLCDLPSVMAAAYKDA